MKPPARTARQPKTAARARRRFIALNISAPVPAGQSRARHGRFDNARKIVNR
jgi:hypothetical protein